MPPPDPATIIYCIACRRPTNGKGWFGGECQCGAVKGLAEPGPSVGTRR